MKNNRGITLVELIISISLISIVILFLFQLLVDVRYSDNRIDYARNNQQTRAVILKTIQDDFLDYGLIGLSDDGSTDEQLIITFKYPDNKTGVLTVENTSVIYVKANGETEKWTLEPKNSYMKYNIRCVSYKNTYETDGEFFSIWLRIPLDVKKESKNVIDDLELFYIGKKSDVVQEDFDQGLYLGNYDINQCG